MTQSKNSILAKMVMLIALVVSLPACENNMKTAIQSTDLKSDTAGVKPPDLTVLQITSVPTNPAVGSTVQFSAVVKNIGLGNTKSPVTLKFLIDGTQVILSNNYTSSIPAGSSITLAASATYLAASAGAHVVEARVDYADTILESNESNNSSVISMTVIIPSTGGVAAVPSDKFVDSIGVITLLFWGGTHWDTGFDTYKSLLGESGIRYVRTVANSTSIPKLNYLYETYGIKANVRIDARNADETLDMTKISRQLMSVRDDLGVDRVISLEGPNEYSDTKYHFGNLNWASQLRAFTQEVYRMKNADSQLRNLPLIAPSIWKRKEADHTELGDISAFVDQGNLHYYTGGRKPTVFNDRGTVTPIEVAVNYSKINAPGKIVNITETGYNNLADGESDSSYSTPERTQAKYVLRTLAETFKRSASIGKTYIYNFIDNGGANDNYYGLLYKNFTPKPAYFAVKNAISILSDKGAAFTPGSLNYTLKGNLTDVVQVVTQKRNGRFYLMIWMDVDSIIQSSPPVQIDPTPRPLSLDVSSHQFSSMKVYLPTGIDNDGAVATSVVSNPRVVNLAVPDQVMIVELIP